MTLRKIALGIGTAIAIAIVVVLLLQHGIARIGLPWIEKKPRIVVLRPEGLRSQEVLPGIIYLVDAPHGVVHIWSPINPSKNVIIIRYNVSGSEESTFLVLPIGNVYVEIDKPGRYVIYFRTYSENVYKLSILVNRTYNCTMILKSDRNPSIKVIRCDLPYRYYPPQPPAIPSADMLIGLKPNFTVVTCTKVNATFTSCKETSRYILMEISVGTPGPCKNELCIDLSGRGVFKIETFH